MSGLVATAHEDRLALVRDSAGDPALTPINGMDFIDVDPADAGTLFVTFVFDVNVDNGVDPPLTTAVGAALSAGDFSVQGGERITPVLVQRIGRIARNQLAVTVAPVGDFSTYNLQIGSPPAVPPGFDPMLCSASFIFHPECATQFDCKQSPVCPPTIVTPPPIDYTAKDYPAFVQVMLDRMSLLAPRWTERNAADLGVAVVELLAYVADQLSYRHDVVDTEAYLETARLRTSVRRHARLVDYYVSDGCNARVWLALTLFSDLLGGVPAGTRCCTGFNGASAPDLPADVMTYSAAIGAGAQFFEVLADRFTDDEPPAAAPRALYAANNVMPLYNWSAVEICLPIGATSATLDGHYRLSQGDVVLFAELVGPQTGAAADANPANRCAVELSADGELDYDPLYGTAKPITRVAWDPADALTFPLCISSVTDTGDRITGVSAAYGNVILADHGRTLGPPLESMPEELQPAPADSRFRPQLAESPLTFAPANPYMPGLGLTVATSAVAAATANVSGVLPELTLQSVDTSGNELSWFPLYDLLEASQSVNAFVTEVENDGTAFLRFGDGTNGRAASTDMSFAANYRIGNGSAGNVGRDTIVLIDRSFPEGGYIAAVTNPLPAFGGVDPETNEHVRQNAPVAFLTQERCVTAQDYADRALQVPGVAQAAGTFRWTGSWLTMFVTIAPAAGVPLDVTLKTTVKASLDLYRMAGVDLEVEDAVRVPLHVALHICVKPEYVATDVEAVLLQVFSDGVLADGALGMFNPQRFAMGQPVYLSPLVAAAQSVDGVQSVRVDAFEREAQPGSAAIAAGVLVPGRLELFELANDPTYPERGRFDLSVDGGL